MAQQRLLIAGCGALGMELARLAASQGYTCFGLRRRPPAPSDCLTWVVGDVLRAEALELPDNLSAVVYAVSADSRSPERYRAAYVDGLASLLTALARRAGRLPRCLFVSSTAVWGQTDGAWVDEETPVAPGDACAEQLVAGEDTLARLAADGASLRAGGLYGAGRNYALERARSGMPLAAGAEQRWTNRIHLHDAARAILALLQTPRLRSPYALVDGRPSNELELMTFLAGELGLATPRIDPTLAAAQAPGARLGNKRVRPTRLRDLGFVWRYPSYVEGYRAILQDLEADQQR
jgi:nucleoside-diphosphate-sugar epimerase